MIHPTRTNLLLLKDRSRSVAGNIDIMKARRQALMREFMNTTLPFIKSREDIRKAYGMALDQLSMSIAREGEITVDAISRATDRDITVEIVERSIWGLKYKDLLVQERPVRSPDRRGYDFFSTTPHLEEGIHLFEKVLESMLELAAFENKLKRLGDEITMLMRKIRVLEERVLPQLRQHIKVIAQYIGERDRESYYRLKRFKGQAAATENFPRKM
ncbi:MAG: ATPase [Nitrospira bacterium SG8_35_1]|nr:MAG: ATPase [Nitrospira bacterium SG8_35_1]